jgi:hypothetical protein
MSVARKIPEINSNQFPVSESVPVNGPAAAVVMAAGISCATLGIDTLLVEAGPKFFEKALNLYPPVGPLAGKVVFEVLAFVISWIVLGLGLRGKNVNFRRWAAIAFVLILIGLLGTFPPVFEFLAGQ